ncbi:hypothetical protein ACFQV4_29240 [Streptomyces thermocarboxydus]
MGTTVKRLRTGYEVDDYRTIARDSAVSVTQDRGGDLTLSVGQRTPGSDILAANPSLQGTATGQRATHRHPRQHRDARHRHHAGARGGRHRLHPDRHHDRRRR